MTRRLAAVAALAALTACSAESKPVPPALVVTASPSTAPANGVSTITITVSASTAPPITVSTTRGQFSNGQKSISIPANGDAVLQSCNSTITAACAGLTTVTAVDSAFASGRTTLTFTGAEICTNGGDDDGDGFTDCADPDCNAQTCTLAGGGSGTCQGGACLPPVCTPVAEVCDNGADDDCDGDADCADPDCNGQACSPSDPNMVCNAGSCASITTGLGLQIAAGRSRMPADGLATTPVTVTLTSSGGPVSGATVTLATDLGAVAPASATTDTDGKASFTFTSSATAGTATLTAGYAGPPALSIATHIAMPALGSIQVASIQNPVMGVKTSGFNEQNAIKVLLLDTEQKPYPDGLAVSFEHEPLGRSEISKPWTDSASCTSLACLRFLGATRSPLDKPDTEGIAQVNLYSGTAAGLVSVRVSATAGLATLGYTVQNIAIVGAKASGMHVSVFCTPLNVPAFILDDCTNSFYTGPGDVISCTAYLADRFNNVLGRSTRVDFRSEAGSAGPPVVTKDYDPAKGGDQTADLGFAVDSVAVTGYPIPRDVAPLAGEFNTTYDSGCGSTVHNPRDGLGTVIAAVQGEEGFVDQNGNGVYDPGVPPIDPGEPFVDQGEPFVDENDNGFQDGDEPFIDVNQDGVWNGPNGQWDPDAVVWAEARVLYTGLPAFIRWLDRADTGLLPGPTPPVGFNVNGTTPGPATSDAFDVYFADRNHNPLATLATFDVAPLRGRVDAKYLLEPNLVDNLGMAFTQQFCDAAPPAVPTACYGTCRTSPCYRVTRLGGFSYGNLATALITGVEAGADSVRATATINGITAAGWISGVCN